MRAIFSVLGLLIVVAVIGMLAKKQLTAPIGQIGVPAGQAVAPADPATAPSGNVRQQSQQFEDQYKKSLDDAMRQSRPESEPESQ